MNLCHSFILSLIGVKHVVLAVNKIDLVDYDQTVFDAIEAEYRAFAKDLGFETLVAIPLSLAVTVRTRVPSGRTLPLRRITPLLAGQGG